MNVTAETKRREGALACMDSLRRLIAAANDWRGEGAEDYFTKRHEDAKAFTATFGPAPLHIEGAITALAEYIHFTETTGIPCLEGWGPFSAKTEDERAERIADMEADMEADRASITAMHNVIPLRR